MSQSPFHIHEILFISAFDPWHEALTILFFKRCFMREKVTSHISYSLLTYNHYETKNTVLPRQHALLVITHFFSRKSNTCDAPAPCCSPCSFFLLRFYGERLRDGTSGSREPSVCWIPVLSSIFKLLTRISWPRGIVHARWTPGFFYYIQIYLCIPCKK